MNITRYLAAAIRANDLPAYQRERYPVIPDGEIVQFVDENFSGVDFDQFVMGFFAFEKLQFRQCKAYLRTADLFYQFVGSECGFSRRQSYY